MFTYLKKIAEKRAADKAEILRIASEKPEVRVRTYKVTLSGHPGMGAKSVEVLADSLRICEGEIRLYLSTWLVYYAKNVVSVEVKEKE